MPENTRNHYLDFGQALAVQTAMLARQRFIIEGILEASEGYDDDGHDYFQDQLELLRGAWYALWPEEEMPSGWNGWNANDDGTIEPTPTE